MEKAYYGLTVGLLIAGGYFLASHFYRPVRKSYNSWESHEPAIIPTPNAAVNNFDTKELLALDAVISLQMQSIYNEWKVDSFPKFLDMMHIPSLSWDTQKYKFIQLLLEKKHGSASPYVLGFSGSSVTAGHDNYLNESFPYVVERRLAPVFAAVFNKTIETRNHAIGRRRFCATKCIVSYVV